MGNAGSGACDAQRFLDTESNLGCAFSEGFAHFAAGVARPDLGTYPYRDHLEANNDFPGCTEKATTFPYDCIGSASYEGSLIEGAYAAFLFDLVDSGVEAHDSIAAPGSYVRDMIRTCEVNYSGGGYRRADGADEVAFCVENAINPSGYFTVRGSTPSYFSESATESGGWTSARARNGWTWNLYDKPY